MTDTEYATTEQLNKYMVMMGEIPNPSIQGADRPLEVVGVGDDSETTFYIDNAYIISGSYTVYYGATEAGALAQPLTETTHYTLDKDLGKLTLTSAGVTLVSTSNIYIKYKFNTLGFTDSELQTQLNRSAAIIDKKTNNHWTDGTLTTPDYTKVTNEKHTGQGRYNRDYFLEELPLPDISTVTTEIVGTGSASIAVQSTNGFPSSGYLGEYASKITYSGKTGSAFTGVSGISSEISTGSAITPFVFEVSTTNPGTVPTWTILKKDIDYDLDLDTAKVHVFNQDTDISYGSTDSAPNGVPNRFRGCYISGNDSIPDTINNLCLMITSADILHRAVRMAHAKGLNDYIPDLVNVDEKWITDTINSYKIYRITNT